MIICMQCKRLCLVQKETTATFVDSDWEDVRYNARVRIWRCPGCKGEVLEKLGVYELQTGARSDGEIVLEEGEL